MALETVGTALIRRHIGRRLVTLREKAGLTQEQAARAVDLSRSTIVRMEDGVEGVRFKVGDVNMIVDAYKASESDRQVLLALTAETRNGRKKSWWHDYTQTELPEWFGLYVMLEDSATLIRQYESELVPGLLQIEEYAEGLASKPTGYLTVGEVKRRVQVRMDRQALLSRPDAPRFEVILNEAVIRRPFGQPEFFRRQLAHLLDAAGRKGVSIRILPWSVGMHAGMVASAFTLLDFPKDPQGTPLEPPLAYVDTLTGAMYLNKPEEVDAYELVWRDLKKTALSAAESRELIKTAMEELPE
ncbi:helix-turn-helix domain-containing protein [Nocardia wallacei]|uniref:helix-turn-helix domain-containing protein n=1 Tax=Nocardia wallacei TaxID=480035 RepID=UPI002455A74C|nr:helix-turn-helix transcriptional regulator [Nocardia wallacei]